MSLKIIDIFTCEDIISSHVRISYRFYQFVTTRYTTDFYIINVYNVQIPWKFYHLVNFINYSNSFANPILYALRILEFRETLVLCCVRRSAVAPNMVNIRRARKKTLAVAPAVEIRTSRTNSSQLECELKNMDTEL